MIQILDQGSSVAIHEILVRGREQKFISWVNYYQWDPLVTALLFKNNIKLVTGRMPVVPIFTSKETYKLPRVTTITVKNYRH
jgi:hypothetical protein